MVLVITEENSSDGTVLPWPRSVTVCRHLYSLGSVAVMEYGLLAEYKPILEEVEKILAEAGLDEEEMRRGAALGGGPAASGQSRNRR